MNAIKGPGIIHPHVIFLVTSSYKDQYMQKSYKDQTSDKRIPEGRASFENGCMNRIRLSLAPVSVSSGNTFCR